MLSELINLLEAEPSSRPEGGIVPALTAPGPDIPTLRKTLAVLVSTDKAKEAIGVQELSNMSGNLALKCGRFLATDNMVLITAEHIDFDWHLEKNAEVKLDEIPQQSSTTAEEFLTF